MKKYIPNALSVLRIAGALALAFLPLFEKPPFFAVYIGCAVLDFADGFFAKTLNAKSFIGDRLDHIASILFVMIISLRLFADKEIPDWVVFTITGIAVLKCASMIFGAVRFKKAPFIGSDWNKAAKVVFYMIPLWYLFAGVMFTSIVVTAVMAIATVEEFIINVTSKEYNPEIKTIIPLGKLAEKFRKKRK